MFYKDFWRSIWAGGNTDVCNMFGFLPFVHTFARYVIRSRFCAFKIHVTNLSLVIFYASVYTDAEVWPLFSNTATAVNVAVISSLKSRIFLVHDVIWWGLTCPSSFIDNWHFTSTNHSQETILNHNLNIAILDWKNVKIGKEHFLM